MQQTTASNFIRAAYLAIGLIAVVVQPCIAEESVSQLRPSSLLRLSAEQFAQLGEMFEKAYQETDFSPTLTNSYFSNTQLYDMVALPVVQTPYNDFRVELFSHIYDPKYSVYKQLNENSVYHNLGQRQLSYLTNKSDIAVGLGFVAPLSDTMSMKTILSSHDIPGYGDSKFSIGLEFKY